MSDVKYYCGCAHSTWGLLILFTGVNLFISMTLLPVSINVFTNSITVRSAAAGVQTQAKALDAAAGSVEGNYTSGFGASLESNLGVIQNFNNRSAAYDESQMKLTNAENNFNAVFDLLGSNPGETPDIGGTNLESRFTPALVYTSDTTYDVVLKVNPNAVITSGFGTNKKLLSAPALLKSEKLASVNTQSSNTKVQPNVWSAASKRQQEIVESAMIRDQVFGALFFLQTIISFATFFHLITVFSKNGPPTKVWILSLFGMIFMFLAYAVGYSNYGAMKIPNSMNFYISNSDIGDYIATPYVTILNFLWPIQILYGLYALKEKN